MSNGLKFDRDGNVIPLVGNTVVCHFDQQGANAALFKAMLDIYRDGPRHAFMKKVTLLPPSSYHMTIFSGADELNRKAPLWPAGIRTDADMATCHAGVSAIWSILQSFFAGGRAVGFPIRRSWQAPTIANARSLRLHRHQTARARGLRLGVSSPRCRINRKSTACLRQAR